MQTLAQEKGRGCLCGNARPVEELERHQATQVPANCNINVAQEKHETGAAQEAAGIAQQAIDTSGYSEATPGPNGETFSLASPEMIQRLKANTTGEATAQELGLDTVFHASRDRVLSVDAAAARDTRQGKGRAGFYTAPVASETAQYQRQGSPFVHQFELPPEARIKLLDKAGSVERLKPEQVADFRSQGFAAVAGRNILGAKVEIVLLNPSRASNGETFSLAPLGPQVRMIRDADIPAVVRHGRIDPFATVRDDGTLSVWNKAWKSWEKQHRDSWRGVVQTPDGPVQISGKTDEEMRKLAKGEDAHLHYEAAAQLPALLKNSVLAAVESEVKGKPDVAEVHRRYAWMEFADGKVRSVLLTVFRWDKTVKRGFDTAYSEEVHIEVQPQPVLVPPSSGEQAGGDTGGAAKKTTAFISGIKPEHHWQGATFSLRSGDFASRMAAAFSPFQRSPEMRLMVGQVAKLRALKLGQDAPELAKNQFEGDVVERVQPDSGLAPQGGAGSASLPRQPQNQTVQTPTSGAQGNDASKSGGSQATHSLRKFGFPSRLGPAVETLRNMKQAGEGFITKGVVRP